MTIQHQTPYFPEGKCDTCGGVTSSVGISQCARCTNAKNPDPDRVHEFSAQDRHWRSYPKLRAN
jgi:hypothetical protein